MHEAMQRTKKGIRRFPFEQRNGWLETPYGPKALGGLVPLLYALQRLYHVDLLQAAVGKQRHYHGEQ